MELKGIKNIAKNILKTLPCQTKICNETPFVLSHAASFVNTTQLSISFRAPVGTTWGCVWLTDRLSPQPTHTARWQPSYLAAQWVNRTTSLSACHTQNQRILKTAWKVCLTDAGCSTWKHRKGEGPCVCNLLGLWKQVQRKIIPSANPRLANYSFDPPGMYITIGGR